MDEDSSAKFIGSLTKFLQSLCNGYVEFQKGVELVGHIYLSIDTGEKVDYILHEKVSKNDENSVSFVSNSFHAQPTDKKDKTGKDGARCKDGGRGSEQASDDDDDDDDDDIMIVDQSERIPGSTNTGTMPNRALKRPAGSDSRLIQHSALQLHRHRGNSSPATSQSKYRQSYGGPSATVTNQNVQQDNINIGDVKLEQLSADDLLSLASHVDEGASSSHASSDTGPQTHIKQGSPTLDSSAGQPVWIKQEVPDGSQGGHDTGWPRSRDGQSDSSNSGSDLYPVMMHQNPTYSSNPVFPGFASMSGQSSSSGSRHHSQSHPGMSGAANPYASPGTSQGMGGIDPAVDNLAMDCHLMGNRYVVPGSMIYGSVWEAQRTRNQFKIPSSSAERERLRDYKRQSRQRIRENPARLQQYLQNHRLHNKKYYEKKKLMRLVAKQSHSADAIIMQRMMTHSLSAPAPSIGTISRNTYYSRIYRQRLKEDPARYKDYLEKQLVHVRRYKAKKKLSKDVLSNFV